MRFSFPAFGTSITLWNGMDYTFDLFLVADIVSRFFLAFPVTGILVYKRSACAQNYLVTKFWWDLLCVLPIDLLYWARKDIHALMRFNRCGLLARVGEYFSRWERGASRPYVYRLVKLVLLILLMSHFVACTFFAVVDRTDMSDTRVARLSWTHGIERQKSLPTHELYLRCMFWATTLLTGTGPDHNLPRTPLQYAFMLSIVILGVLVFATVIGEVGNALAAKSANEEDHKKKLDTLAVWMRHKGVHPKIQDRVRMYYNYIWFRQSGIPDGAILDDFPPHLRSLVSESLNRNILRQVPMFRDLPNGAPFLDSLMALLRPEIYSPGDHVVRQGDIGQTMFFITRGIVDVVVAGVGVVNTLQEGRFFGEKALLVRTPRNASIIARTFVDVFSLERFDVEMALRDFPNLREPLYELAELNANKVQNPQAETARDKHDGSGESRSYSGYYSAPYADESSEMSRSDELQGVSRTQIDRSDTPAASAADVRASAAPVAGAAATAVVEECCLLSSASCNSTKSALVVPSLTLAPSSARELAPVVVPAALSRADSSDQLLTQTSSHDTLASASGLNSLGSPSRPAHSLRLVTQTSTLSRVTPFIDVLGATEVDLSAGNAMQPARALAAPSVSSDKSPLVRASSSSSSSSSTTESSSAALSASRKPLQAHAPVPALSSSLSADVRVDAPYGPINGKAAVATAAAKPASSSSTSRLSDSDSSPKDAVLSRVHSGSQPGSGSGRSQLGSGRSQQFTPSVAEAASTGLTSHQSLVFAPSGMARLAGISRSPRTPPRTPRASHMPRASHIPVSARSDFTTDGTSRSPSVDSRRRSSVDESAVPPLEGATFVDLLRGLVSDRVAVELMQYTELSKAAALIVSVLAFVNSAPIRARLRAPAARNAVRNAGPADAAAARSMYEDASASAAASAMSRVATRPLPLDEPPESHHRRRRFSTSGSSGGPAQGGVPSGPTARTSSSTDAAAASGARSVARQTSGASSSTIMTAPARRASMGQSDASDEVYSTTTGTSHAGSAGMSRRASGVRMMSVATIPEEAELGAVAPRPVSKARDRAPAMTRRHSMSSDGSTGSTNSVAVRDRRIDSASHASPVVRRGRRGSGRNAVAPADDDALVLHAI